MNNLHEYNEFKNMKKELTEQVNEGAQLFQDDIWKVRTRVEIPQSLINAYAKKVKDETGENLRAKWSDQEIAEEITKYVTNSFMSIENLPTSMTTSVKSEPTVQTQEEMPAQTQVQTQVETEVPAEGQAQTPAQAPAQTPAQAPAQSPAQVPAQGAQKAAQTVPQTQAPTAQI